MASQYLTSSSSSKSSRIEALRKKHSLLSTKIDQARKSVSVSDFYLTQLKKQKLLVKEELEGINSKAANA